MPIMGDLSFAPCEGKFCKYQRGRHEYENMDLEPHKLRGTRSSQLCELPTSYIANNCQSVSGPMKPAKRGPDYFDKNWRSPPDFLYRREEVLSVSRKRARRHKFRVLRNLQKLEASSESGSEESEPEVAEEGAELHEEESDISLPINPPESNQWLGSWDKHMKSPMFQTLKENQKLNHFPGTFQLGRKDRLWRNFQRLINKYGYKEFGFIPQTFVLPQELKLLKQNWDYKNGSEAWIIKPPASARGVGIKVINKWSQLPKKMSLVVQRYISNPYLINGSKFDLRLYVLVTSFDPLRIYLYPDGLARFASAKYSSDSKDLKDRYMHLTNYSINKLSSQYTPNEDANACQGHKWTITKLLEYMSGQGIDTKNLWKNLQSLVIKTIITGESPIQQLCEKNMSNRYNCYELFGVDILLDENLKAWLLEVNISPSLHSSSPLDAHVKGPLVQTLFDLAQFHFPPRLAQVVPDAPQCYEPKLYSTALTRKEREKHNLFIQYECRDDYLDDILVNLTGDDVRMLTQAEDEWCVKGRFERIFPTAQTYKYLNFLEVRYYNRLFDAWENKYERNRGKAVDVLRKLCEDKVHLKVARQSRVKKNLPNMTPGCVNPKQSKEGPISQPVEEIN